MRGLRTKGRIFLQASGHSLLPQRVDWLAAHDVEFFSAVDHGRRYSFVNLPVNVSGIKRRLTSEQFVYGRAQRIDIVQRCTSRAIELLRAHVN